LAPSGKNPPFRAPLAPYTILRICRGVRAKLMLLGSVLVMSLGDGKPPSIVL